MSQAEAVKAFEKKFEQKSGVKWSERGAAGPVAGK